MVEGEGESGWGDCGDKTGEKSRGKKGGPGEGTHGKGASRGGGEKGKGK